MHVRTGRRRTPRAEIAGLRSYTAGRRRALSKNVAVGLVAADKIEQRRGQEQHNYAADNDSRDRAAR